MLRIHFEAEDLARTTIAPSGDVLWEILLGLHALQDGTDEVPFNGWRRRARSLTPPAAHPLFELAPPNGYSADFLTPTRGRDDIDEGLEKVLATPADRLTRDLTELARQRRAPSVARGSAAGTALRRMAEGLRSFFTVAVKPYWRQIARDIEADRARRVRTLGEHGVERLLETVHPRARWRHPVLEVDDYVDQDLHLRGRGLVLLPSFFCRRHPLTLKDPERPPLLLFPVDQRTWLGREEDEIGAGRPLEGLLGRTRTTVLETSVAGCGTTDIARAAGISPASASHHTRVLREAGLITTRREGCSVRHEITELGLSLLAETPRA